MRVYYSTPCCGSHQYFSFQANPPMLYKPAVSQLSWPLVILWFWSGPAPASFCVGPKEASSEQQKTSACLQFYTHHIIMIPVFPLVPWYVLPLFVNTQDHQFFPFFSWLFSKSSRHLEDLRAVLHDGENTPQKHPSITSIGCHLS